MQDWDRMLPIPRTDCATASSRQIVRKPPSFPARLGAPIDPGLSEALVLRRERSRAYVCDVLSRRSAHRLGEVGVLPYELGMEAVEQPKHIVDHQHLAVARGTRADADCRN